MQTIRRKSRTICAILLTMLLMLSCTGCDVPPAVEGTARLADIPVPTETTVDHIWYTFPFSAEQANQVFFGDKPCRKRLYYNTDNRPCSDGYEVLLQSGTEYASYEQWRISPHDGENLSERVLDGVKEAECRTFHYYRNNRLSVTVGSSWLNRAMEPESGELLQAVEYHPANDEVYDAALSDSAARLAALGYTDVECIFSSRMDLYNLSILYRAYGHPLEPGTVIKPYYVVQYRLQSADTPAWWTDSMDLNNIGTATFYYDEDGLSEATIHAVPCRTAIRSEKVRYTPEEALRQIPESWFRPVTILVDAYYEPVLVNEDTNEYKGCWTFRFVAPSELDKISDAQYDAALEQLGIAGRYMEMQCRVFVNSGDVTGGDWLFSRHLIHEYNSKHILIK